MGASADLAMDQSGVLERLDVFRCRRERHGKGLSELAHGALTSGELAQHPPARGIAESMEYGVELSGLKFNHMVELK
jgi:hypothetical protein